jgi:hypothetical protein
MMAGITPEYDFDLYSDESIRDPWPRYAALRRLGVVVWLPRHGNFAITRHAELTAALKDPLTFISGKGVAADEEAIEVGATEPDVRFWARFGQKRNGGLGFGGGD